MNNIKLKLEDIFKTISECYLIDNIPSKSDVINKIQEFADKQFSLLFLDIDGVLNHKLFIEDVSAQENLIKLEKQELISKEKFRIKFYANMIDPEKIKLLNVLCKDHNIKVVISSTWRKGRTTEQLQELFKYVCATFQIVGKTGGSNHGKRGLEIYDWLKSLEYSDDAENYTGKYIILDDDSDMLLWQRNNYFHVDGCVGLTPNICYKIEKYLNGD